MTLGNLDVLSCKSWWVFYIVLFGVTYTISDAIIIIIDADDGYILTKIIYIDLVVVLLIKL